MSQAMELFKAERTRQIESEGWSAAHDDEHQGGELFHAAMIYLWHDTDKAGGFNHEKGVPMGWPWDATWWKPKDRRSNLIRAGALMLAEKERLGRIRWRDSKGTQNMPDQIHPVRVYIPRIGKPTNHIDHKIAIAERELAAMTQAAEFAKLVEKRSK